MGKPITSTLTTKKSLTVLEFEALDRTYVIAHMLDMTIGDHPALEGNDKATEFFDEATTALWNLYRALGGRKLA